MPRRCSATHQLEPGPAEAVGLGQEEVEVEAAAEPVLAVVPEPVVAAVAAQAPVVLGSAPGAHCTSHAPSHHYTRPLLHLVLCSLPLNPSQRASDPKRSGHRALARHY